MSVDILLMTCNRLPSLIACLSGIAGQSVANFRLIVSDGSEQPARDSETVRSLLRIITARGATVTWFDRPRFEPAPEAAFLLGQASAEYVLLIEDNAWLAPQTLQKLLDTIQEQQCGFVGAQPDALVENSDRSSGGKHFDLWDGSVQPEAIEPGQREWLRERLNQNSTFTNLSLRVPPGQQYMYKIAFATGAVLYHRQKLSSVGGFSSVETNSGFPSSTAAAQNRLMRQYGGCSLLPSGVYHTGQASMEPLDHVMVRMQRDAAPQVVA